MTDADFRDALRLLNRALALLPHRRPTHRTLRRHFRSLRVEACLLHTRLGRPRGQLHLN
jgi:hypothetical protein